jgi:exopolysaccharide production protein ExoQ
MTKVLIFAEKLFTVVSLVFFTGGPLPIILMGGFSEGEIDVGVPKEFPQLQASFFLIYLLAALLLLVRWKKVIYTLSKDRFVWLLLGIAIISVMWSFSPPMTINRSIALVGTSFFGLYLASRYTIKEQLNLLAWTFGLILILSLVFAVALPKYGIMAGTHAGAWRGIYVHKNVFGKIMVMSALVFLLQVRDAKRNIWLWLGLGLSICFLVLAKSTASLINVVTIFALLPVYQTFRWRYHLMIPAVIAIVTISSSVSLWFMFNADTLLGAIGKDTTLTGRADMWPYIMDMIAKQPWLGYGYSGFWQGWDGPSAYVWSAAQWTPPNSHNGLLDLWLDLGLLGLSVFIIGFGVTLLKGLTWLRLTKSAEGFWPLLYLTYMLLTNVGESSLLNRNEIFWVLYVATALSMMMLAKKQAKVFASITN